MLVLTRPPGASYATGCLVTFVERRPIDTAEAVRQHARYREALAALGCRVVTLPPLDDLPDSVFVEDTAIVLPEVTVLCRPGAVSRRGEVAATAAALADAALEEAVGRRPVRPVEAPATLEGGDVLRLGRRLFVGRSSRTNEAGVRALADAVRPFAYEVVEVEVAGALHLQTACSALDEDAVLVDPALLDPATFAPASAVEVHPDEPAAANAFRAPGGVVMGASGPRTAETLRARGYAVRAVELSEIEKGEGGPTCLALAVSPRPSSRGAPPAPRAGPAPR